MTQYRAALFHYLAHRLSIARQKNSESTLSAGMCQIVVRRLPLDGGLPERVKMRNEQVEWFASTLESLSSPLLVRLLAHCETPEWLAGHSLPKLPDTREGCKLGLQLQASAAAAAQESRLCSLVIENEEDWPNLHKKGFLGD